MHGLCVHTGTICARGEYLNGFAIFGTDNITRFVCFSTRHVFTEWCQT